MVVQSMGTRERLKIKRDDEIFVSYAELVATAKQTDFCVTKKGPLSLI